MIYLKGTQDLVLTLESENLNMMQCFIDGSHTVNYDCKGDAGSGLTLVKGRMFSKSMNQKINSKRSTQMQLMSSNDVLSQALWSDWLMKAQDWKVN